MPELKPSTVLLILAVVVVVAVYVLGVGLGATDRTQGRREPISADKREAWRQRFLKPRPVKEEELTLTPKPGCVLTGQTLRVPAGQTCVVAVKEGGARARTVEVAPQASRVDLNFTPKGKPSLPVSKQGLTDARKFDVMKEGAEVSLGCQPAPTGAPPICTVLLR